MIVQKTLGNKYLDFQQHAHIKLMKESEVQTQLNMWNMPTGRTDYHIIRLY